MKMANIPFCTTDWSKIERVEYKGETGTSFWAVQNFDEIRVRIVEYSAGFLADHWCKKGHVFFCLEGELYVELEDGREFTFTPGVSYQVADDAEPHRHYTKGVGAKFFVVD